MPPSKSVCVALAVVAVVGALQSSQAAVVARGGSARATAVLLGDAASELNRGAPPAAVQAEAADRVVQAVRSMYGLPGDALPGTSAQHALLRPLLNLLVVSTGKDAHLLYSSLPSAGLAGRVDVSEVPTTSHMDIAAAFSGQPELGAALQAHYQRPVSTVCASLSPWAAAACAPSKDTTHVSLDAQSGDYVYHGASVGMSRMPDAVLNSVAESPLWTALQAEGFDVQTSSGEQGQEWIVSAPASADAVQATFKSSQPRALALLREMQLLAHLPALSARAVEHDRTALRSLVFTVSTLQPFLDSVSEQQELRSVALLMGGAVLRNVRARLSEQSGGRSAAQLVAVHGSVGEEAPAHLGEVHEAAVMRRRLLSALALQSGSTVTLDDIANYQIALWTSVLLVLIVLFTALFVACTDVGVDTAGLYAVFKVSDSGGRRGGGGGMAEMKD